MLKYPPLTPPWEYAPAKLSCLSRLLMFTQIEDLPFLTQGDTRPLISQCCMEIRRESDKVTLNQFEHLLLRLNRVKTSDAGVIYPSADFFLCSYVPPQIRPDYDHIASFTFTSGNKLDPLRTANQVLDERSQERLREVLESSKFDELLHLVQTRRLTPLFNRYSKNKLPQV